MTSRLPKEIQRLYRLAVGTPAPDGPLLQLVGPDGTVRTLVVSLSRPAEWAALSALWRGVQMDLDLPAPAIAVNGVDAFELWFSLAEPVSLADADAFLHGLRERYLSSVKPHRLQLRPGLDAGVPNQTTPLIPAPQGESGNWSAFVAPDLAAVFGDEPWLDLPPGEEAQADALGRLASIPAVAFEAALQALRPAAVAHHLEDPVPNTSGPNAAMKGPYEDPRQFLLDVMNNAAVPLVLRVDAAKALLGAQAG